MGELGKCAQFFRIFFIIYNVLLMLTGLAILAIGIYLLLVTSISIASLSGDNIEAGPPVLIACGVTTIVVTALGIPAGIMLWRPILVIYIIGLAILILLNMVTGIVGFLFYHYHVVTLARIYSASRLHDVLRRYRADPFTHWTDFSQDANDAVANVQRRFHCCGTYGPQSWIDLNLQAIEESNNQPPFCALCNSTIDPTTCDQYTFQNATKPFVNITFEALNKGCVDAIQSAQLDIAANAVEGGSVIAFATCIFGIVGIPLSIGLICCITKSQSTQRFEAIIP